MSTPETPARPVFAHRPGPGYIQEPPFDPHNLGEHDERL
jgi:hypothetical protein